MKSILFSDHWMPSDHERAIGSHVLRRILRASHGAPSDRTDNMPAFGSYIDSFRHHGMPYGLRCAPFGSHGQHGRLWIIRTTWALLDPMYTDNMGAFGSYGQHGRLCMDREHLNSDPERTFGSRTTRIRIIGAILGHGPRAA